MNNQQVMDQLEDTPAEDVLLAADAQGTEEIYLHRLMEHIADEHAIHAGCAELAQLGLLDRAERSMGGDMGRLTPRGRQVAQLIANDRASGQRRFDKLRLALLRWLPTHPGSDLQDFQNAPDGTAYGSQFNEQEIRDAVEDLHQHGYIDGIISNGWSAYPVELKDEGRAELRSPAPFRQNLAGGITQVNNYDQRQSTVNAVNSQIAAIAQGDHAHQDVTATWTTGQRDQVAGVLQQVLDLLEQEDPDQQHGSVHAAIQDAHQAAQDPTATRESLKDKVVTALTQATITGLTGQVPTLLAQLVQSLT